MFEGAHNEAAEDEVVAFTCPLLEAEYRRAIKNNDKMEDLRPEWRLTAFTFFCEKGHLVPFDRKVCSSLLNSSNSIHVFFISDLGPLSILSP